MNHRLEKTSKIIKSNCQPNTTVPTKDMPTNDRKLVRLHITIFIKIALSHMQSIMKYLAAVRWWYVKFSLSVTPSRSHVQLVGYEIHHSPLTSCLSSTANTHIHQVRHFGTQYTSVPLRNLIRSKYVTVIQKWLVFWTPPFHIRVK